ncbi:MAG TPA: septal ring lytic transglycosylase RlpA family protein [Thermodesulfobacteriota bacterium]|nr:septal ring lytic transglycosylase RlpA family protein [Thermodesulfobacteriota bacterium]
MMPFIFSCSYTSKRGTEAIIYPAEGYTQTGIASWYGVEEHGKKAASGERFSMYGYTAAHKSLPLGTMARVTNLENGKDVIVRINDRGPFVGGRIIDLSYTAAKSIDMIAKGTARVKVEVISVPGRKNNYFDAVYTVQVASFNDRQNAFSLKDELSRNLDDVRVEPIELDYGTYYRVRVGRFPNRGEAEKVASKLRKRFGYRGNVILE